MVALSRKPFFSTFPSISLILLAGSCLLTIPYTGYNHADPSSYLVSADPITRDQLYAQGGFVRDWVAPMPTAPIAGSSVSGGSPGGEKFVVRNWPTTYKNIAIGGNDISFIADPLNATSSGHVMQVNYPKGSYAPSLGPVTGGTQFYAAPFGDKTPFEKIMVSYDVLFPNGFNWVLGGKLPGIYGGTPYEGCSGGIQSTGSNCLTMRFMWRPNGLGEVYAYIPADAESKFCENPEVMCNDQYGKSIGRGQIYFTQGNWNHLDMVMELNEPAGNQNGTLRVYLNGNQVISMNNVPYRSTGMVGFQGLMFSSFFGGADVSYATPVDANVYFKNIQLSVGQPATLYEGTGGSGSPRLAGDLLMIKSVLIFNNHGNPRLTKFYQPIDIATQQALIKEIFSLISKRPDTVCNFLEGSQMLGGQDTRVIYRHYATLYFVFVVDESESELGILDLIQVFVESLDRCFENVCELDLIFHFKEVHDILAEVITGGMVLETDIGEIVAAVQEAGRLSKKPAGLLAQKSPF
ncbi:AP-3 complex subunit sigma-1 [Mortierella sp. AM989]|nr:AP-3 complex subunit sigma-1 [Mortierella sp. AM989]